MMFPYNTCDTTPPFFVGVLVGLLLSMYIKHVTKDGCKYYLHKLKNYQAEDIEAEDTEDVKTEEEVKESTVPAKDENKDSPNMVSEPQPKYQEQPNGIHSFIKKSNELYNKENETDLFIYRTSGKYATMKELEDLQKSRNDAHKDKNIDARKYQVSEKIKKFSSERKNALNFKRCDEFPPHIQSKFNELRLESEEANQC